MFSPPTKQNSADGKRGSFTRAFSKASQMITGQGPPLYKQLKLAISEGNEEKAIAIYQSKEGGKSLMSTLHPSKPFPSKKNKDDDTPLHLTAKYALLKLFHMFLEYGGNPAVQNSRLETCAHVACTMQSNPAKRADIVEAILQWQGVKEDNMVETVSIDEIDIDGNTAIHLAAYNGLLYCVEKLVFHGADLSLLNNTNLTCAEYADIGGRAAFGTMLELACVFRAVDDYQQASHAFHSYQERPITPIILNSDSMTLPSLMKFINQAIAFVRETTGENAARSEVLLGLFAWEAGRCKKEYLQDTNRVLGEAGLMPKVSSSGSSVGGGGGPSCSSTADFTSNASVSSRESRIKENSCANAGVAIEDVFVDSTYRDLDAFPVYRDGKRFMYHIRTYNNVTGVYPTDYDPSVKMLFNDQNVSANSHIKPAVTEPCPICGERMHEPASVQHFLSGNLVEPKHREIHCNSGHKYCFNCWSDHLQAHVLRENGVGCLPCPGFKCGEALDLQWAPVMLKSPDLVNRLYAQRQRCVIDSVGLRWCPVPKCGLLVHIPNVTYFGATVNSRGGSIAGTPGRGGISMTHPLANEGANAGNIPQVAMCANGHGFCLSCNQEAHSPCSCNDLTAWVELVREESRYADPRDPKNVMNILLVAPNHKLCPECKEDNGKEDGSNHMRCLSCHHEFCWQCLQPWVHHKPDSGGFFHCNRYIDDRGLLADDVDGNLHGSMRFLFDEESSKNKKAQKRRIQRVVTFLHHFSRYQGHRESMRMEFRAGQEAIERISHGLKSSKEGELLWLLGEDALNPYEETPPHDMFSHINDLNVRNVKDTVITNYYISREKAVEFLLEAYEELEKARLLLRWSYPYSLFEFHEVFKKQGQTKKHPEDYRVSFEAAQNGLEMYTEMLSDLIARRRVRGTKSMIVETVQSLRTKRSDLENLIVQYSVGFSYDLDEPVGMRMGTHQAGQHISSDTSLTSSSKSDRNSPHHKRDRPRAGDGDIDMEAVLTKLSNQEVNQQHSSGPVRSGNRNVASSGYAGHEGSMLQRQYSDYPMETGSQSMRDFKEDEDSDEDVGPYMDSPEQNNSHFFATAGSVGSKGKQLKRKPSSFLRAMQQQDIKEEDPKRQHHSIEPSDMLRKDRVTQQPPFLGSRMQSSGGSEKIKERDRNGSYEDEDHIPGLYARRTSSGQVIHVAVGDHSRSASIDPMESYEQRGIPLSPQRPSEESKPTDRPGGMVIMSKGGKRLNVRGKPLERETTIEHHIEHTVIYTEEYEGRGKSKGSAPTKTTFKVGGSLNEVLSDNMDDRHALARGLRQYQEESHEHQWTHSNELEMDIVPSPAPVNRPQRSPYNSRDASRDSGDHRASKDSGDPRIGGDSAERFRSQSHDSHADSPKFTPMAKIPVEQRPEPSPMRSGPRIEQIPHHHVAHHTSSLGNLKHATSLLLEKHIIVHIEEDEAVEIRQMMLNDGLSKDEAVHRFFDDHDDKLYNPKAAYLFPGEVYVPPRMDDDGDDNDEEELFGHVEYHHRSNNNLVELDEPEPEYEPEEPSIDSNPPVEQRFIGLKKDPDQEALEHAMLLSKQEAEFGANMYDSLTMDDQEVLDEYMAQGFTREEGALIIFEEKYGKCSDEKDTNVTPAMPTLHAIRSSHLHGQLSSRSFGSDIDEEVEDDPEVEKLISKGYTREQAVQALSQRGAVRGDAQRSTTVQEPLSNINIHDLTEEEEMEMEGFMTRGGYTPEEALAMVLKDRRDRIERERKKRQKEAARLASPGVMTIASVSSEREVTAATVDPHEAAIIRYMDMGYTREQAVTLVRNDTPGRPTNTNVSTLTSTHSTSTPATTHSRDHNQNSSAMGPNFNRRNEELSIPAANTEPAVAEETSPALPGSYHVPGIRSTTGTESVAFTEPTAVPATSSGEGALALVEDPEIVRYMDMGYTRDQAQEMVRSNLRNSSFDEYGRDSYGGTMPGIDYEEYSVDGGVYRHNSNNSVSSYGTGNNYAAEQYYPVNGGYRQPHPQPHHSHGHGRRRREQDSAELQSILAQQERDYGINMYDAFTPQDEPEMDRLMGMGYSYHDAMQIIFEYRYPPTNTYGYPAVQPYGGGRYSHDPSYPQDQYDPYGTQYPPPGGGPPVLLGRQQSLLQQRRMQGIDPRISSVHRQASYGPSDPQSPYASASASQSGRHGAAAIPHSRSANDEPELSGKKKRKSMLRASSILGFSVGRKVAHSEGDVYMRAAELSRLEQEGGHHRNGKKRVPKMKYKERDVEQLTDMGFNREQAVQALIEHKNDVGAAADALLSLSGR